jgi:hypothetical protein
MPLRAFIQFLVILIGVAFEAVRMGQGEITPFLLNDQVEWFRSYVYYVCEHLKFITISLMMWLGSRPEDFKTDRLFVMLAALDFFDYVLWGNNLWFSITVIPHENGFGFILPMSMNVFSLVVFGSYVYWQWKTNGKQYL